MYYNANLNVTINGNALTTVVSAKIEKNSSKIGTFLELIVPLNCYIAYKDQNTQTTYLTAIRTDFFPQGTTITVQASYDGYAPVTVFSGFVYDFVLGTPLTIKCADYIYFLELNVFGSQNVQSTNKSGTKIKDSGKGINYKSATFVSILQQLIAFTNQIIQSELPTNTPPLMELILPVPGINFVNLTFISMSPAAILEYFKKNLFFNITLYGNKLYVNLASNTLASVPLSTGTNVIKSSLQNNSTAFEHIRMKMWFINTNGTRSYYEVGDQNGRQEEGFLYNVANIGNQYATLANEALLQAKQHHYRGELETLLYPTIDLYYKIPYTDLRYPEKNGNYVVQGITIELDEHGFHQKIKVAWLDISTYTYLTTAGQTLIASGNSL